MEYTQLNENIILKSLDLNSDDVSDPALLHINKEFIDMTDLEPNNKTQQLSQFPSDLLNIAFNIFSQGICKKKILFQADIIESEMTVKNLKALCIQPQSNIQLNHHYRMNERPQLLTGISDCIQIYASHATFIYKSLLSINLKIINQAPFKIDNLKLKINYTYGLDIFPQNTNPSFLIIEEINTL